MNLKAASIFPNLALDLTTTSDPRFLKASINFDPPLYGKSKINRIGANCGCKSRFNPSHLIFGSLVLPIFWFYIFRFRCLSCRHLPPDDVPGVLSEYIQIMAANPRIPTHTQVKTLVAFGCFAPHIGQLSALSLTGAPAFLARLYSHNSPPNINYSGQDTNSNIKKPP